MKKKHTLIILIFFVLLNKINAQNVNDLTSSLTSFTNTKNLNLNGNIKSVKEFTCKKDDISLLKTKECTDEIFYEFDTMHRIIAMIYPRKDSVSYTYDKDKVKEARYEEGSKNPMYESLYSLNKEGNIYSKFTKNSEDRETIIYKYDTKNNLIENLEYNNKKKINSRLKIDYDNEKKPNKLVGLDGKGKIIINIENVYKEGKVIKSKMLQGDREFKYLYTYDNKGNLNTQETYDSAGKLIEKIEKEFDSFGNEIKYTMSYNNISGETSIIKRVIEITYDKFNNWTKKIISFNEYIIVDVKFRTIEYY